MEKIYPKVFTSMDEIKFVINNFPKEVWEEDFKDLLARTQGYIILGKNPRYITNSKNKKVLIVDPLFTDEFSTITEGNTEWEDITPFEHPSKEDVYTFRYNGTKYLAQYGGLPYPAMPWLDTGYVANALLGLQEVNEKIEKYENGLKEAMEGITWVNDEGQEVDEHDNVIKRMVDINSLDPFENLNDDQLMRLFNILKNKLHMEESTDENQTSE